MIYSSTSLKPYDENCPGALDHLEKGTPYDRELFNAGIAAHAVLQAIAEKNANEPDTQLIVADAVVDELLTKGRSYNDIPEPPMSPSDAFAGRDLALKYVLFNDLPESIISVEGGYGMTASGQGCGYSEEAVKFRAAIDLVYEDIIGDEEWASDIITVRDYKSAWPTGEADLETLQRKGQAVLVYKRHCTGQNAGKYAAIRQEAVNLQTGMSFTRDINLDDEGLDLLKQWERDILTTCRAADQNRQYRPGAGCMSCRFAMSCDACMDVYRGKSGDLAEQYIATYLVQSALAGILKERTKEAPIKVNGGYVGYRQQEKKVPISDAHQKIADIWSMGEADPPPQQMLDILKAEKLTAANVENILKVAFPGRGEGGKENMESRRAFLDDLLEIKVEARFDVFKGEVDEQE